MAINLLAVRLTGMAREDGVVLLFCGSKKSLVSGVPMAGALFAPAQVGMIVLPLMIFHQLQLFVCAWLAARFARQGHVAAVEAALCAQDARIPRTPEEIAAVAAGRGLSIPAPCMQGVAANLELLSRHAERLRGAPGAGTT
jgi:sodium/bile acid cotransporter 7